MQVCTNVLYIFVQHAMLKLAENVLVAFFSAVVELEEPTSLVVVVIIADMTSGHLWQIANLKRVSL